MAGTSVKQERRLAILITHLGPGGAERVSADLAGDFAQSGWSVTIITLDQSVPDFYPLIPSVSRISLPGGMPSGNPLTAILNNISRFRALRRTLRSLRSDVLLGMTSQCAVLAILVTAVAAERNYPSRLRIPRAWHCLRKTLYRHAAAVVVQSDSARQWIRHYTGAENIAVIPNPISLPLPSHAAGLSPDDCVDPSRPVLLAVGRLTPQKGFAQLIEAFGQLHQMFPEWTLVIVGEGPQRDALRKMADAHGLGQYVLMPGTTGNIARWYRRAEIFVLSSAFEGFPNVLLEAMAHGKAVVSFNCQTGPNELIDPGRNGLLVEPVGDPTNLAKALASLMSSPEHRESLGAAAVEVLDRYRREHVVERWQQALNGVFPPENSKESSG